MIRYLIAGTRRVFGWQRPGRNLEVFPDDVFLVSFPKSGNTWTRFLVANLLYPERNPSFGNINDLIPDPEALSKRRMARIPRPRIIKSHQYFDPRYPRVIYIVRDPRDVVLSRYHFHRKRRLISDDSPLEPFVELFLTDTTSPYGSWSENVASWLSTRSGSDSFLLLRYEDMMAQTQSELAKVAKFLGVPVNSERIDQAVHNSSADTMRKLEKEQDGKWSTTKDTRKDVPFVRAAKSGGWRSELPEPMVAKIETAWGPLMRHLGYELAFPQSPGGTGSPDFVLGKISK
jgi:hypothetical protein